MGLIRTLLDLALVLIVVLLIFALLNQLTGQNKNVFNITNNVNVTFPKLTPKQNYVPRNQTLSYILSLINADRRKFGLPNVSYSNATSGQQHSDSMLKNAYFSHWDPYGLKPYMRYSALGGRGSVEENVAYMYNSAGVNVLQALQKMEYNMMYNDSSCCSNGHKYNILAPDHNEVSIGISYNTTTAFLTEDFIDDYIVWFYGTPNINNNMVTLVGGITNNDTVSAVEVVYDQPLSGMSVAQLRNTSSYGYGNAVAGIGYSSGGVYHYYPGLQTINASTYISQNSNFRLAFDISGLINKYGAGEYTVLVWITNRTSGSQNACYTDSNGIQHCTDFVAATYTLFVNSSRSVYTPTNV